MDISIKDLLYMPDLRDNLLYVSKFTKNALEVNFKKEVATVSKEGKLIATAQLKGELYEIEFSMKATSLTNVCNVDKIQLWHKRFGHIGQSTRNEMTRNKYVVGLYRR